MGYCALSPPPWGPASTKGLLMKGLLIMIICLLAVGLIALVYALKALTRREPAASPMRKQHYRIWSEFWKNWKNA